VVGGGLGGDAYSTYTAVPLLLSSRNAGLLIEDHPCMVFDLRQDEVSEVEPFADRLQGRLFAGQDPLHLLEVTTRATGRMQPLPDWRHTGAVIGTVGGADWARELGQRLDALRAPVSAWFLQDWVGERSTAFDKRRVWN
jgi:alpha-glucosidase